MIFRLQVEKEEGSRGLEEEKLIGSVASAWLKREHFEMLGYGLYATSKRLIGIELKKVIAKSIAKNAVLGAPMRAYAKGRATAEENSPKTLQELEGIRKDFEIGREQISRIELTRPGTFRGGHLRILAKSGHEIGIIIGGKKEYESLGELMKAFLPDVVTIKE
jgi:hypothetical protein